MVSSNYNLKKTLTQYTTHTHKTHTPCSVRIISCSCVGVFIRKLFDTERLYYYSTLRAYTLTHHVVLTRVQGPGRQL